MVGNNVDFCLNLTKQKPVRAQDREIMIAIGDHYKNAGSCLYTSVSVRFSAVALLKSSRPRSFVLGHRLFWSVPDSIPSHRTLRPLATICPPSSTFHPQTVPLPLHPLPCELAPIRPRVHSARLETRLPCAGELALLAGSGADAVPVSATLVRPSAVRPAVVKVEMADGALLRLTADAAGRRLPAADDGTHPPDDGGILAMAALAVTTWPSDRKLSAHTYSPDTATR